MPPFDCCHHKLTRDDLPSCLIKALGWAVNRLVSFCIIVINVFLNIYFEQDGAPVEDIQLNEDVNAKNFKEPLDVETNKDK